MKKLRNITVFVFLLFWSCVSLAAATVITASGHVQMTPLTGNLGQLAPGQRVESGAAIKTGEDSSVILRFDDGHVVALSAKTSFVLNEYKFNAHKPEESSFIASLLKGGMRAVTGIIGEANKNNVTFKTDVATIGIRGTDFMLFYDDRLYLTVLDGVISVTNEGGEEVFDEEMSDAKSLPPPVGRVVNAITKAKPITIDELPAAALSVFRVLQMLPLSDNIREPDPDDPTCADRREDHL